jgi:hypothetical protein
LSNSGTGFSGLVRLADATDRYPEIVRSDQMLSAEDLVVLTPENLGNDLSELLRTRQGKATLVVLPKWNTQPDKKRPGWVTVQGLLPELMAEGILSPEFDFKLVRARGKRMALSHVSHAPEQMAFVEPHQMQGFTPHPRLTPLVWDGGGRILLGQVEHLPLYILADPDLINNHGIADARQARAALAMLDFLNSTDADSVFFDVTLNGLGSSRSPLRLAFDPPFLAVTVAIFVALLLAALQAIERFGAPQRAVRAIAFGKAALVDNSAALIRKAGREASLADRYVNLVRERAAATFRLPSWLEGDALSERLDALPAPRPFSEAAAATTAARKRGELLGAAQTLHRWLEETKG